MVLGLTGAIAYYGVETRYLEASSHREAPMIADDPLADNTDVYAFRSPDDPNSVTIIASYIGLELPQGGPNYAHFGENIRYEVHVKTMLLHLEMTLRTVLLLTVQMKTQQLF
ncbi:MAG: DUF4331 domain-containing protein [Saprospiraceae bacterium]|nr:DUF4331 domain-containing protein [Saprospiraceae bacterium]